MIRVGRRTFLKGAALVAWPSHPAFESRVAAAQVAVPNSTGTEPPTFKAPALACDCHIHIYDGRFPMVPSARVPPLDAAVPQYKLLQRRIGTSRVVVVTPRNYATQNDVTLDAIAQLGPGARGVAVVHPSVTDAELIHLNRGGVRGIRFSLNDPATAAVRFDMVEPLSARVADLGWHVQFNLEGDQIVEWAAMLRRLPTAMVFDHMGNPPLPVGAAHPSNGVVRDLIDRGRTWVKLSGPYLKTPAGPPYPEATKIARSLVRAVPERMVWGSDWPHPTAPADRKPNDALLFDLLLEWTSDERTRDAVLVKNPAALYGFATAD